MNNKKRGTSTQILRVRILQYTTHKSWPPANSKFRLEDTVLNLIAYYVEEWIKCENLTQERGGTPLQSLTKSSIKGILSVVTVADGADSDPDEIIDNGSLDGWKISVTKLLRNALTVNKIYLYFIMIIILK
jgi:hypothetical protein